MLPDPVWRTAAVLGSLGLHCLVASAQTGAPAAAPDPRALAYEARTVAEAQAILGIQNPEPGRAVRLIAPDVVDGSSKRGARAAVQVTSFIPGTDWIAVFVDRGATPLVSFREFPPGHEHQMAVTVPMFQTGTVRVVVRAAGKYYQVAREVKVARQLQAVRANP